jgi:hypothetical protein
LNRKWKKLIAWPVELAKWGLVIFLLLPLRNAGDEKIDFTRIVLGILFFIIFSGKMFYDVLLDHHRRNAERSAAKDIFSILGIVLIMALVVGLVVASIGFMVYAYLQQASAQPSS